MLQALDTMKLPVRKDLSDQSGSIEVVLYISAVMKWDETFAVTDKPALPLVSAEVRPLPCLRTFLEPLSLSHSLHDRHLPRVPRQTHRQSSISVTFAAQWSVTTCRIKCRLANQKRFNHTSC